MRCVCKLVTTHGRVMQHVDVAARNHDLHAQTCGRHGYTEVLMPVINVYLLIGRKCMKLQ